MFLLSQCLALLFLFQLTSISFSLLPSKQHISLRVSRHPSVLKNTAVPISTNLNEENQPGFFKRVSNSANILYKFSRPHTIKGTILASSMGVSRALIENPGKFSTSLLPRAMIGLFALLCGNAFIVGINQIYDEKIDVINKPFLPIAAKQLSSNKAWILVISCLVSGITIVKTQFSPLIFRLYCIGTFLGTIYSVPPFQFKRYPLLAGGIIATVRGFLLNFGVYYAVREALMVPFQWNPVVLFISTFMTMFASVIAVTKDLPDIEGDIKYNINTFAAKYGVGKIATAAAFVLSLTYAGAIALPFMLPGKFKMLPMAAGHSALLAYFLVSYFALDPNSTSSIKNFYKSIWNLFYLEYMLYPFI